MSTTRFTAEIHPVDGVTGPFFIGSIRRDGRFTYSVDDVFDGSTVPEVEKQIRVRLRQLGERRHEIDLSKVSL